MLTTEKISQFVNENKIFNFSTEGEKKFTVTGESMQVTTTCPFELEKFVAEFYASHKDFFEELARR